MDVAGAAITPMDGAAAATDTGMCLRKQYRLFHIAAQYPLWCILSAQGTFASGAWLRRYAPRGRGRGRGRYY